MYRMLPHTLPIDPTRLAVDKAKLCWENPVLEIGVPEKATGTMRSVAVHALPGAGETSGFATLERNTLMNAESGATVHVSGEMPVNGERDVNCELIACAAAPRGTFAAALEAPWMTVTRATREQLSWLVSR